MAMASKRVSPVFHSCNTCVTNRKVNCSKKLRCFWRACVRRGRAGVPNARVNPRSEPGEKRPAIRGAAARGDLAQGDGLLERSQDVIDHMVVHHFAAEFSQAFDDFPEVLARIEAAVAAGRHVHTQLLLGEFP